MAPRRYVPLALVTLLSLTLAGCLGANAGRLQKCTILLPTAYNDGTPIPASVLTDMQDRLYSRFGGYTVAGCVTGTYRMVDGTRASDESLEIWVAVPPEQVCELRRQAAYFCGILRQESLYFEVAGGTVELIGPLAQ